MFDVMVKRHLECSKGSIECTRRELWCISPAVGMSRCFCPDTDYETVVEVHQVLLPDGKTKDCILETIEVSMEEEVWLHHGATDVAAILRQQGWEVDLDLDLDKDEEMT